MKEVRGSHKYKVQSVAYIVFEELMEQEWFGPMNMTKINNFRKWFRRDFNRATLKPFQDLLLTSDKSRYDVFPPILFPDFDVTKKKEVFLNPALIKVSHCI